MQFRGGSDTSGGGSYILGGGQIFFGGIRYFWRRLYISAGFGYCRRDPINRGGAINRNRHQLGYFAFQKPIYQ